MRRSQNLCRPSRGRKFVVHVRSPISHRVSVPRLAILVHQCQKKRRVQAATQQESHGNVTQELALDSSPVEFQEVLFCFLLAGHRLEWFWTRIPPALYDRLAAFLDNQPRTRCEFPDTF